MSKELSKSIEDLRCQCGKIVCQVKEKTIVIKCRHCKRFIIIRTEGFETTERGEKKIDYRT